MRSGIAAISCCLALSACSTRPPTTDVAQAESTKHAKQVPQSANPFTTFETLQVRPLALSPSGNLLFALNTPDNRLEIFNVAIPLQDVTTRDPLSRPGSQCAGTRRSTEMWKASMRRTTCMSPAKSTGFAM